LENIVILLLASGAVFAQTTVDTKQRFAPVSANANESSAPSDAGEGTAGPSAKGGAKAKADLPRFEVGAQFTLMSVRHPQQLFNCCVIVGSAVTVTNEPGLGGRFTYNLNRSIGFEGEMNFFLRNHPFPVFAAPEPGGHMYQGQFGIKAGKRFERFGVFGKFRPGFVGFTQVNQLVGTQQVSVPIAFTAGVFKNGRKEYLSYDLGGVVEIYISRRILARTDLGDTIIRYGEFQIAGQSPSLPILRRPPETRHNFQITGGIGFRF